MSAWAYKNCNKCKEIVHIHGMCVCGGDPWNVIGEKEEEIFYLTKNKQALLDQVAEIDKKIDRYKIFLSIHKTTL